MSKSGFTMVELLVVLAIIVVVMTISIPTIDAMTSPKHALRKEGMKVMQLMVQARTAAMARKVRVDLRIDPATREVRMVETRAFQSLQLDDPYALADADDTNRYEKTIVFDEEYTLDSFTADRILTGEEVEEESFSQAAGAPWSENEEPEDQLAVSFTHFGGSSGGGITLVKDDVRLDIAADILTGRPGVVRVGEPESGQGGAL